MFNAEIKVDYNKVINDDYLGSGGVYHGFAYQEASIGRGMTDEAREREFARVAAMKLPIARTWYRPDYSQDMKHRFIKWMKRMKELNVDIALNAGWWFTKDIWYFAHENFNNREYTSKLENYELCCDKFAAWIAKSVELFIEVHELTNIKYLVLFTEPTSYRSGDMPEGISDMEAYALVCRKIHNKLIEYGLRDKLKLIGPNGVFTSYNDKQLSWCAEHLNDVIDIYSIHTYSWCQDWLNNKKFCMTDYEGWLEHAGYMRSQCESTGKPLISDEYGLSGTSKVAEPFRDSGWYGNYIAMINAAFLNGGIDGSFIWLLFDQQYFWNVTNDDSFHNGVHRWGTCYMPGDDVKDSYNARPSWYVMQLLGRYMSARRVLEVSFGDGICSAAVEDDEGHVSVMAVNLCPDECTLGFDCGAHTFRRYLYEPSAIKPEPDKYALAPDMNGVGGTVETVLPPFAVAVWTDFEN